MAYNTRFYLLVGEFPVRSKPHGLWTIRSHLDVHETTVPAKSPTPAAGIFAVYLQIEEDM